MPDILVKQNFGLPDTVALIVSRINTDFCTPYIASLCQAYNGSDPDRLAFLSRLQDYVYRNVEYKLDPEGKERVYMPTTTISNAVGDCKKMTVIIGSALRYLNIPFYIKHIFYYDVDFTHVYIIVPWPNAKGYVTLDPVQNPSFDHEVGGIKHADIYDQNGTKMPLYTGATNNNRMQINRTFADGSTAILNDLSAISGCAQCMTSGTLDDFLVTLQDENTISGIGKSKKTKEQKKERRKKVIQKTKKIGLAAPRLMFLALVHINALKLAEHLARAWQKDPARTTKFWTDLGGDVNALKKEIVKGSKQTISYRTGVALEAMILTATPALIAAAKLFKDIQLQMKTEDQSAIDEAIDSGEEGMADDANTPQKFVAIKNATVTAMPTVTRYEGQTDPPGTEGANDTTSIVGGDAWGIITTWPDWLYLNFRSGFYYSCVSMTLGTIGGILFTIGTVYYLFIHQPFFRNQLRKLRNKFFKLANSK